VPGTPTGAHPTQPTQEQLEHETKALLSTADLATLTKKQIREQLGALFGVNLNSRKAELNKIIDSILQA
jgi:chitin synthase